MLQTSAVTQKGFFEASVVAEDDDYVAVGPGDPISKPSFQPWRGGSDQAILAPELALRGSGGAEREQVSWQNSTLMDASFYNLADGACMYQWEYGILIGYGFAIVFAIGSAPAGWVCDRR